MASDLWEDMAIQIHSMKSKCSSDDELTFQIDGDKIVIRNIFQEQRNEHLRSW